MPAAAAAEAARTAPTDGPHAACSFGGSTKLPLQCVSSGTSTWGAVPHRTSKVLPLSYGNTTAGCGLQDQPPGGGEKGSSSNSGAETARVDDAVEQQEQQQAGALQRAAPPDASECEEAARREVEEEFQDEWISGNPHPETGLGEALISEGGCSSREVGGSGEEDKDGSSRQARQDDVTGGGSGGRESVAPAVTAPPSARPKQCDGASGPDATTAAAYDAAKPLPAAVCLPDPLLQEFKQQQQQQQTAAAAAVDAADAEGSGGGVSVGLAASRHAVDAGCA